MTDPSGDAPGDPSADPGPALTRREAAQARKAPEEAESTGAFPAQVRAARSEFESQVAHARAEFEEANERIKQRTGRNLIVAILIGLASAIVLIGSLVFVKWRFLVLALAALVLGTLRVLPCASHRGAPGRCRPAHRRRGLRRPRRLLPQLVAALGDDASSPWPSSSCGG